MNDTITAISTALGVGAIAIIRVSGEAAIPIVSSIFEGKDLNKVSSHTIHYGYILEKDQRIDEVLVSVMKAPKTYTREDMVEINCHGSIASTKKILEILLIHGCRLANPGEFTRRAFLNGRIDLLQAQGVKDMLEAPTEEARVIALSAITGNVSNRLRQIRNPIADVLAQINVKIDYPEYEDIEEYTTEQLSPFIDQLEQQLVCLHKESENGQKIKEGIKTAIIGKPNVGKSSLLNLLLEEEKAIVTDIEGTTRDIVEGTIYVEGVSFTLIDTAGIRNTTDKIEQIGVDKSMKQMEVADFLIFVLNQNEVLSQEEQLLLEKALSKPLLIILNKNDLPCRIQKELLPEVPTISVSSLKEESIGLIKSEMKKMFELEQLSQQSPTYLTNAASLATLQKCISILSEIKKAIQQNVPIDMLEIDLRTIWDELGKMIGESYEEELLDHLFANFCIGK